MNILIIDDSVDFRLLLRLYLKKEINDVNVVEYDPCKQGKPAADYNWAQFDIVLLDYKLGADENGLDWLRRFKDKVGFPPTIILTGEGNEYIAVRAIKLGAADYISKADISPRRITSMIKSVLESARQSEMKKKMELDTAAKIIQDIQNKPVRKKGDIGYKFVKVIGSGSVSKVYLAERVKDKLTVALKVLDLTQLSAKKMVRRFIQEAELISSIDSSFLAKIYEYGITKEYGYIAMEFFSRGDLKQRMEVPLSHETAATYAIHIAYALDQVHRLNVVHRDLKPANIMFRADDSLALADFGISKKLDVVADITTIGQVLGTPYYMSPEQGEGREIDTRTDLYSLGVLLYELITGEKPYKASTVATLIYQHVHQEIPRLPPDLVQYQDIIDLALAKKPENRYQSAKELIRDLEHLQSSFPSH